MQPAEPLEGEQPEILHKLDLRYGYDMICMLIAFPAKYVWNGFFNRDGWDNFESFG